MSARLVWAVGLAAIAVSIVVALLVSLGVPDSVLDDETQRRGESGPPPRGLTVVEIESGAGAREIGATLEEAGVVESKRRFETLVTLFGYDDALVAGVYDFEPGLVTTEVVERIRRGSTGRAAVTIPEGLRLEEIAERFAESGVVSADAFLAATRERANWAGTLAALRPVGTSLEGYLFPSTYELSRLSSADDIVRLMLARFDEQWPAQRLAIVSNQGRTLHTVLTVASIVEREAVLATEQPVIASVFWNRLAEERRLEADPTVQYALAEQAESVTLYGFWKSGLTLDDLGVESPYNTYVVEGLPPTPIAAPGAPAMEASLHPDLTPFFYFVARGDGSHAFATTFAEHLENVQRFQSEAASAEDVEP